MESKEIKEHKKMGCTPAFLNKEMSEKHWTELTRKSQKGNSSKLLKLPRNEKKKKS